MAYTFNGSAKTITIGGTGAVTITANDLYSRWVDWVQSGVGAGYDEVVRAIGGEDIGGGLTAGVYVFLSLGWSLVVPTAITTLTVQGNVTRDPGDNSGAPLYVNQGAAQIVREVSAVALGYSSGSGLSPEQDARLTAVNALAARLNAMLGDAGAYDRWLATALELAPSGGSGGSGGGFTNDDRATLEAIEQALPPNLADLDITNDGAIATVETVSDETLTRRRIITEYLP